MEEYALSSAIQWGIRIVRLSHPWGHCHYSVLLLIVCLFIFCLCLDSISGLERGGLRLSDGCTNQQLKHPLTIASFFSLISLFFFQEKELSIVLNLTRMSVVPYERIMGSLKTLLNASIRC